MFPAARGVHATTCPCRCKKGNIIWYYIRGNFRNSFLVDIENYAHQVAIFLNRSFKENYTEKYLAEDGCKRSVSHFSEKSGIFSDSEAQFFYSSTLNNPIWIKRWFIVLLAFRDSIVFRFHGNYRNIIHVVRVVILQHQNAISVSQRFFPSFAVSELFKF